MATLIVGTGALVYGIAHKKIQQRRDAKAHNAARFSELEKANAARIARLRELCACGGDHTPADHPGGGGRPMDESDAVVEDRPRSLHDEENSEREVRRARSMPAARNGAMEEIPPPPYEEVENAAAANRPRNGQGSTTPDSASRDNVPVNEAGSVGNTDVRDDSRCGAGRRERRGRRRLLWRSREPILRRGF